jgi:hypothetical protein
MSSAPMHEPLAPLFEDLFDGGHHHDQPIINQIV